MLELSYEFKEVMVFRVNLPDPWYVKDNRRLKLVCENKDCKIYSEVVYSEGLNRKICVAFVEHFMTGKLIKTICLTLVKSQLNFLPKPL